MDTYSLLHPYICPPSIFSQQLPGKSSAGGLSVMKNEIEQFVGREWWRRLTEAVLGWPTIERPRPRRASAKAPLLTALL